MFESEFEQREYEKRQQNLNEIVRLTRQLARERDPASPELPSVAAAYPNSFRFTHTIPQIRAQYDSVDGPTLEAKPIPVAIAGRIMAHRAQGKAGFAQLQQDGQRLQIYVRLDHVGDTTFQLYKALHLGDHVGVSGALFRTRTGELTVQVASLTFLAAAMLPLPSDYYGIEDIEQRYRRRYLDLILNTGHTAKAAATPAVQPATEQGAPRATEPGTHPATEPGAPNNPVILSEAVAPFATAQSKDLHLHAAPQEESRNVREVFVKRAAILRALRTFFDARGYLEVETPMMHTISGGAAARPFETHHNALDIPLKLRIAPELYLKRLVVGGFDRVYEINRNFRNEGVSTQHNPEFTMLEFYQAYANYHDLMDLTQEIITFVAMEVNGTTKTNFPIPKGPRAGEVVEIDLANWTKLSMREAIIKFWPQSIPAPELDDLSSFPQFKNFIIDLRVVFVNSYEEELEKRDRLSDAIRKRLEKPDLSDVMVRLLADATERAQWDELTQCAKSYDLKNDLLKETLERLDGRAYATVFEILAEEHLIQPTIIYDFPLAVSPLSKVKPEEPDWVERFEFYIGGFEVGNAFSELNDPEDQRRRFQAQLDERARGDEEAMAEMDDDYVRALGYGLPPTAGEGIGIDRLTMVLTGSRSIRDVILFPLLRPQTKTPQHPDDPPHAQPQSEPIK